MNAGWEYQPVVNVEYVSIPSEALFVESHPNWHVDEVIWLTNQQILVSVRNLFFPIPTCVRVCGISDQEFYYDVRLDVIWYGNMIWRDSVQPDVVCIVTHLSTTNVYFLSNFVRQVSDKTGSF